MQRKWVWLTVVSLALTACGGGETNPPPPPPVKNADISSVAVGETASVLPADWYRQGPFMEIFVRSYADSNGDGKGDIQGLIGKLDYLQSLGVAGIWLMPIYPSYDHDHGYAIENFRDVEPDYGSLGDFKELLAEAHKRGIGVILDYAMDTSAATNPLFIDAKSSKTSTYRDWYVWSDVKPQNWYGVSGNDPWYSTSTGYYFSGYWDQLPDFNFKNPAVEKFHVDNMRYWLNLGVDGFRYDSAALLVENGPDAIYDQPETLQAIARVKSNVNAYSNRFTVCESAYNSQIYVPPCGSVFGFDLNKQVVQVAKGNASYLQYVADYFKTASPDISTFLANHDTVFGERLYTQLNGDMKAYRVAVGTYLTLPGVPFIYYGEEVGMSNGQGLDYPDKALRTPMSWSSNSSGFTAGAPYRVMSGNVKTHNVAAQLNDPDSLLNFYKTLIALRKAHPALAVGNYTNSAVAGQVLHFQRTQGNEKIWVAINYGKTTGAVAAASLPATTQLTPLYPESASLLTTDAQGVLNVSLPAQSMVIYKVVSP